jgi:hypothetical protein
VIIWRLGEPKDSQQADKAARRAPLAAFRPDCERGSPSGAASTPELRCWAYHLALRAAAMADGGHQGVSAWSVGRSAFPKSTSGAR